MWRASALRARVIARLKSFGVYLTHYQLLPYERTSELIADLVSDAAGKPLQVSVATLCHANQIPPSRDLETVEQKIKEQLVASPVVHFDETGLYCNGRRQWLHAASTPELTYYAAHPKRGGEALEAINLLPQFDGTAIHDYWKPYFLYSCDRGLCNAHHLRELIFRELVASVAFDRTFQPRKSKAAMFSRRFRASLPEIRLCPSRSADRVRRFRCRQDARFNGNRKGHRMWCIVFIKASAPRPMPCDFR